MSAPLVLRDVHVPPAPPWWPPAPGWWIAFAAVALALAATLAFIVRRRRRLQAWRRLFDEAEASPHPNGRLAAISELLRRAARKVDAQADRLQGEDWLRLLDGGKGRDFSQGAGRVLLDGIYRRDADADAVGKLVPLARTRFLELMAGKK
jgi:hypothetical protein